MDLEFVRDLEQALRRPGRRSLGSEFTRAELPGWGERLLTAPRLLDLLTYRSLSRPGQVLCLQKGVFLPPGDYLTSRTVRGEELELVDTRRVGQLLKEGCQLVVGGLEKIDPRFDVACRALQWLTGAKVYATAFLTTGDAGGFDLHVDTSDSIIIQAAGSKSWQVRGESLKAPLNEVRRGARRSEQVLWQGTLREGELMCIPRGYWHTATRSDQGGEGYSLHVTFGVVERTGMDWLRALTDRACQVELFRHDLGDGGEGAALVAALQTLAEQYSPTEYAESGTGFLDRGGAGYRENQRVITSGAFGPPAEVVCMTEFRPRIVTTEATVTVSAGERRLTFPVVAAPALELLLSGLPTDLRRAAELTRIDTYDLAETLIEAGLCVEVTEALASGFAALATLGAGTS